MRERVTERISRDSTGFGGKGRRKVLFVGSNTRKALHLINHSAHAGGAVWEVEHMTEPRIDDNEVLGRKESGAGIFFGSEDILYSKRVKFPEAVRHFLGFIIVES